MSSSLSQQVELDHLNSNNNNNKSNKSNTTTATNATTMYATGSRQMMTGLQELASSLNASAARLQDEWHDLSQQQQQPTPLLLPDPIKLLRRIHGLETAVANLQTVCSEMTVRRQVAVHNAVEQLDVLRQLLVENGGESLVAQGNDQSPGQEERMEELESTVQAGYQQFVLHNQDGDDNQGGGDES